MNKQEQKDRAWQEYQAITSPAWKEYVLKCKMIDEQEEDIKIIDGKKYKLID